MKAENAFLFNCTLKKYKNNLLMYPMYISKRENEIKFKTYPETITMELFLINDKYIL